MAPPKSSVKRCPVEGCKVRLDGTSANTKCAKCNLAVCSNHIFPSDHICQPANKPAAASNGTLVVEKFKPTSNSDDSGGLKVIRSAPIAAPTSSTMLPSSPRESETFLPITSLRDEIPEALGNEFIQTAIKTQLKKKTETGKLIRALETFANDLTLEGEILEIARSAFGRIVASSQNKEILSVLETILLDNPDSASPGIWLAYGIFIGRMNWSDDTLFDKLDRLIVSAYKLKDPQIWLGLTFAEALRFRQLDSDPSLVENPRTVQIVNKLTSKYQTAATTATILRVTSLILAGVVSGIGAPQSVSDLKLFSEEPNLNLIQALAEICGRNLEPFVWKWSKSIGELLFTKYAKGETETRNRALLAGKAICQYSLGPSGTDEWVTNLVSSIGETSSWRGKEYAFDLLNTLVVHKVAFLHDLLPSIVLILAAGVVEAKKEVASKASIALDSVGNSVTNPETKKLMPYILDAIKRPDEGTDKCLSELMDATFVNSLNSTSVALIVPVVARALKEGSADLKRRGAIATGNVCSLVRDVEDVRVFEKVIRAELIKLKEHSSPEVRKAASNGLNSVTKALDDADAHKKAPKSPRMNKDDEIVSNQIVQELKDNVLFAPEPTQFTQFVLKKMFNVLMAVPAGEISIKKIQEECNSQFGFLNKQETDKIAAALFARIRKARSQSFDKVVEQAADDDEILVDIKDMILAYASRVLLSKTRLTLKRGHRYGIVGKIGVGKTTLASRLAKGDLENFPKDVSSYMILHEVLQEDMGKTVHQYMGGTDIAKETLTKVGFADPNVLVSTLSGGWRMRLAIAKSMLADADLIVLDEPTNHVDVNGVKWLADYLISLKAIGTTCVIVSHDYDFLTDVATDVLHINNQRLEAFDGGFAEFQKSYPEIAAALPKMKKQQQGPTPTPSRTGTPAAGSDAGGDIDSIGRGQTPAVVEDVSEDTGTAIFELLEKNESNPEAVAAILKSQKIPIITFPDPGKLEGITSKGKPIMTATGVTYAYPSNLEKIVLRDVTCRLSLNSRVALRGANGQGKSTILKLLVGELGLNETSKGQIWKHHNLRVAYVAQHAIHHLLEHLDITPIQYLQRRYYEGRDRERGEMITLHLDEQDKALMAERGEICGIVSRVMRGKQLYYEIEVAGRRRVGEGGDGRASRSQPLSESSKEFRSLAQLEAMNKPHVIKLVKMYDEEMKYEASGLAIRPTSQVEMLKGLEEFGIDSDFAERKIRWLSGGQKSRLVLAAAMWHRPHLICLDEPTNFLDAETLAVLTHSLRAFKGAVLTVSHHESFVRVLCNEAWDMDGGRLKVTILKEKFKILGPAAGGAKKAEEEEE